jgi:acyl dehydratase
VTTGEETLQFNAAGLDQWTEEHRFEVTSERLAEYAAATNDPIPAHAGGAVGNPVFAIVPVFHALMEPALAVVPLGLFGKVLHGEQEFRFHRPIKPGDRLVAKAKMTGFEGLPNGTRACVYLETHNEDGELVNEQYVTFFIRGFDDGRKLGELSPEHRFVPQLREQTPAADFTQHIDDDQTFRYAPASGDPMPIHLDEEVARDSGLPGIIAHGFCVLAFTTWGLLEAVGESDVNRLKRLAVRFARPVLPDQDIHTTAWKHDAAGTALSGPAHTTYLFETKVGDTNVLTDGLAVFES